MSAPGRFFLFLGITATGVTLSHLVGWTMMFGGPLGALAVLAGLCATYAWMEQRVGGFRSRVIPSWVQWSVFATLCVFGGGLVGMMAFNPDGYMQPKPKGPPWHLIWFGTGLGAAAGVFVVGLLRLVDRSLEPPKP